MTWYVIHDDSGIPTILPEHLYEKDRTDVTVCGDNARSFLIEGQYYSGNDFYRQYMAYVSTQHDH